MEEKIEKIKDLIKECDIHNDVLFCIIELLEDITILNDAKNKALDKLNQAEVIKSVCPRCKSNEDLRRKPITYDCMECGFTWQTGL